MKNRKFSYLALIVFHAVLALLIYVAPFFSKLYALLIPIIGLWIIHQNKNKNNEVLFVSAYLIGAEVLFRMTGGNLNNEYVKLLVIFFTLYGIVLSNFSKTGLLYLFFILLLVPAIFVTIDEAPLEADIKKILVFNLSGPVCLAVCSIYTFTRKIGLEKLQNVLIAMGLPILTTTVYLFLYNPSVRDVITGTQSNFETSGGFGPNQVSTILGLGIFIFFAQLVLFSKSKFEIIINGALLIFISYRGIVTFSRGGIFTAVAMIIALLIVLYFYSGPRGKKKMSLIFVVTGLLAFGIWTYSSLQTRGLINKRYANQDAIGRTKSDRLGGREEIMDAEIKLFLDSPVMGVGAGLSKYRRVEMLGGEVASHSEITRLLSEHGIFGILAFLILLITPFALFINNRQNLYLLSFVLFWLLTINHAAMRIAAPAFLYAMSLLSVRINIPDDPGKKM